jgi:hypothetical protein
MSTLRSIREGLGYDRALPMGRFGHLYIPVDLGSLRATAEPAPGGLMVTLRRTGGLYVPRLFVLPKKYWKRVFPEGRKGCLTVFFRDDGRALTGLIPLPGKKRG